MNKIIIISILMTLSISVLIGSAENAYASAVRNNVGFTTNVLEDAPGAGTDEGSVLANIGFQVNFFDTLFNDLFVNNNGNITFESAFDDFNTQNIDFRTSDRKIIAPFFADIDTSSLNSPLLSGDVTYGQSNVDGLPAFGVNWIDVFCWGGASPNLLNSFQLVLIDRSTDFNPGDFDIEFNYDTIIWDTSPSAQPVTPVIDEECIEEVPGGNSAKIGFADGTGDPDPMNPVEAQNFFEFPGSGVSQAFLDSGPASTSLIQNSLNSLEPGRYIIPVRDGIPFNEVVDIVGGNVIPVETTSLLLAGTQSMTWMIPVFLSIIGFGLVFVRRTKDFEKI